MSDRDQPFKSRGSGRVRRSRVQVLKVPRLIASKIRKAAEKTIKKSEELTRPKTPKALIDTSVLEDIILAYDIAMGRHQDKINESYLASLLSTNSETIVLDANDDFILQPSEGGPDLLVYLQGIERLQHIIDEAQGRETTLVRIRSITQNSPVSVTLEGASQAVETVKEIVIPWRRQHAETMARLREQQLAEEIANKQAETFEVHARAKKEREEANRLAAEAELKRAEAGRIRLETQKLQLEIKRAYIEMAIEVVNKIHPNAIEVERMALVTQLLPVLTTLATSPLQITADPQP